jgi:hypothetical protein
MPAVVVLVEENSYWSSARRSKGASPGGVLKLDDVILLLIERSTRNIKHMLSYDWQAVRYRVIYKDLDIA